MKFIQRARVTTCLLRPCWLYTSSMGGEETYVFGWESDNHVTGKNRESRLLPNLRFQRVAVTGRDWISQVVTSCASSRRRTQKSLRSTTDVETVSRHTANCDVEIIGSMNQRSLRRPCSRFCLITSYTSMQQSPQHVIRRRLRKLCRRTCCRKLPL